MTQLRLRREDMHVRHFHLFGGAGFGARGFQQAHVRLGTLRARMECLGGVDSDPSACAAFKQLVGVEETCLDLFDRDQYRAWHGKEPPKGWREATPMDIRAAAQFETPDIVFTSPPCRGFSGLLNPTSAKSAKYQALNQLTIRGMKLCLDAWANDPVPLLIMENVPRIESRGGFLLDQIEYWLNRHGYVMAGFPHNCGELGGLAQNRNRFLLVARHVEKVPPYLYEPPRRRVRGVGEVLGPMPAPDSAAGGPMHRLPRLQWQTWVRLAFVEAGKDWRSLRRLRVQDGVLQDFALVPPGTSWYPGVLGVKGWRDPSATVTGRSAPTTGAFAVADVRTPNWRSERTGRESAYKQYGVLNWDEPAHTVTASAGEPGAGPFSVPDPRVEGYGSYSGKMRVERWEGAAHTVTTSDRVGSGALSVQDPSIRGRTPFNNVYRVVRWDEASQAVTAGTGPTAGGQAVADPMPPLWRDGRSNFETGGHYGVVHMDEPSPTVVGKAKHDRGKFSVADDRAPYAPKDRPKKTPIIIAEDGTWHRPMSTLELAALQGAPWEVFVDRPFRQSDSKNREHIGNGVPVAAAQAVAEEMVMTLLLARAGVQERIDEGDIWVKQASLAISLDLPLHDYEIPVGVS